MVCGGTLAKIFLIVVNIVFFIGGGVLLALGIIALVKEDLLYEITDLITGSLSKVIDNIQIISQIDLASLIKTNAILLIVLGGFLFAVGVLGTCGASQGNALMLKIYAGIVIVILMVEIGFGVYAFMYGEQFERTIKDGLKLALFKTYYDGYRDLSGSAVLNASQKLEESSLDLLQIELKCCGIANSSEWQDPGTTWNSTYEVNFAIGAGVEVISAMYPPSCCTLKNEQTKDIGFLLIPVPHFTDLKQGMESGAVGMIHTTPCFDRLKSVIKSNQDIMIISIVVIAVVEMLAIVFACCLIQQEK